MTIEGLHKSSIGVDYSASAVYLGVVNKDTVLVSEELRMSDNPWGFYQNLIAFLQTFSELHESSPELWIEDQMPIPRNIGGGQKLYRMRTFLELAAMQANLEPCFIHPGTWRKAIYGNGRPEDLKETSRRVAKEIYGFETKFKNQHNQCEGILIGRYGWIQHHPEDKPIESSALALIRRSRSAG